MAKRKNKLLLSDLFPELAAEREVAEEEREREREEPARKVQKTGKRRYDMTKCDEKWNARLEVCKEWKRTKGRFPKANKKDKEENSLYKWLNFCKPGGRNWTQARWEKLNEAFGEGWEKECFPYLGTLGIAEPGNKIMNSANSRDESPWDAILDAVKLFKQTHGRFPKASGGKYEKKLYMWLRNCSDSTMPGWTQERANKLALAFGDRWQSECFPNTIYFW